MQVMFTRKHTLVVYFCTQIRLYTEEDSLTVGVGGSDFLIGNGCLAYVSLLSVAHPRKAEASISQMLITVILTEVYV